VYYDINKVIIGFYSALRPSQGGHTTVGYERPSLAVFLLIVGIRPLSAGLVCGFAKRLMFEMGHAQYG